MSSIRSQAGEEDQEGASVFVGGAPPEPPDPHEIGTEQDPSPLALTREEKSSVRILVVDDEESLCLSCGSALEHEGYQVTTVTRGVEAEELVRRGTFDIVLLDLYMTRVSGFTLLERSREVRPDALVIVMTGRPSVESSIRALREGAWDYLPKPFSAPHLHILMGRAAHTVLLGRESRQLVEEFGERHNSPGITLLCNSSGMKRIVERARKVARTDASVFIWGESGTGKELIAQFLHANSLRNSRPIVAVNCAAIPDTLLESEMFGHIEGAFTGAVRDKPGLMEAANGGTLFLDEITEMSLGTQAKLLRVIQDGVIRRVGSAKTDAVVNVRFIAATNVDPLEAVREGKLRDDLYYRLRVVPMQIPSLRERPDDVPVLARHFLKEYWLRHHGPRRPVPRLADDAVRDLQRRPWKGNVRELQNVIEHVVVLSDPTEITEIDAEQLSTDGFAREDLPADAGPITRLVGEDYHSARDRIVSDFERRYLGWVLDEADGNMSEAARIGGVDRTTLYRLLDKHDLKTRKVLPMNEN